MSKLHQAFAIGDRVWWESQSNGSWVRKDGVIVEVVLPAAVPETKGHPIDGCLRDHYSYIVLVDKITRNSITKIIKPKPYWPRVSALNLCEGDEHE